MKDKKFLLSCCAVLCLATMMTTTVFAASNENPVSDGTGTTAAYINIASDQAITTLDVSVPKELIFTGNKELTFAGVDYIIKNNAAVGSVVVKNIKAESATWTVNDYTLEAMKAAKINSKLVSFKIAENQLAGEGYAINQTIAPKGNYKATVLGFHSPVSQQITKEKMANFIATVALDMAP